ncbi:MAG TPA: type II toxin-antitoxin system RelE/ParE family toxin [Pyrinomonadaceae bacterium]|nr:type II toxin-antitoxin system RelE/ParE family toxin [Pyrinomonadaceae bacterium]
MPTYIVEFTKSAEKEFLRLPKRIRDKFAEAFKLLAISPFSELLRIKKLKGTEDAFRIRVGEYRLIYKVEADQLIVLVIKTGHRSEVYRK